MARQLTEALLRIEEVQARTGLSRSQLYALCKAGQFPKAIPLVEGSRARAWIASEIDRYVQARIEAGRKVAQR